MFFMWAYLIPYIIAQNSKKIKPRENLKDLKILNIKKNYKTLDFY